MKCNDPVIHIDDADKVERDPQESHFHVPHEHNDQPEPESEVVYFYVRFDAQGLISDAFGCFARTGFVIGSRSQANASKPAP